MREIAESGWKVFRQLREVSLDQFCERVLPEIGQISAHSNRTHHERYLAVCRLTEERDRELADTFNNPRRSVALYQLVHIQHQGLLTREEMSRFSEETRAAVRMLLGIDEG